MGSFYGSVQFRTDDRDAVLVAARAVAAGRSIKLLVGPVINGWVGVYPQDNGQDEGVAADLAGRVAADAFYLLVHDDDVFTYTFFRGGTPADAYRSCPDGSGEPAPDEEAAAGRPETYAHLLVNGEVAAARSCLARGEPLTFESDRLNRFARLLGIVNAATAYDYLEAGERTGVARWNEFAHVPDRPDARAAAAALRATKKQLKAAGKLLFEWTFKPMTHVAWCADATGGFLVAAAPLPHVVAPPAPVVVHRVTVPWPAVRGLPTVREVPHTVRSLAVSPDGATLAVAGSGGLSLLTLAGDGADRTLPGNFYGPITFGRGGLLVARSGDGVAAWRWPDLAPAHAGGATSGHTIDVRPDGSAIVLDEQLHVRTLALAGGRARAVYLGGRSDVASAVAELMRAALRRGDADGRSEEARAKVEAYLAPFTQPAATHPAQGNERPSAVVFSSDGRLVLCGTDAGLRAYDADAFLAADGDPPPPRFAFDVPPLTAEQGWGVPNHVHAIAEHPAGGSVLFAGGDGVVRRMDLADGAVRPVLTLPEGPWVVGLAWARDGATVGVLSRPSQRRRWGWKKESTFTFQVWSADAVA